MTQRTQTWRDLKALTEADSIEDLPKRIRERIRGGGDGE